MYCRYEHECVPARELNKRLNVRKRSLSQGACLYRKLCGKLILHMEGGNNDKQRKTVGVPDITPPLRPKRPREAKTSADGSRRKLQVCKKLSDLDRKGVGTKREMRGLKQA